MVRLFVLSDNGSLRNEGYSIIKYINITIFLVFAITVVWFTTSRILSPYYSIKSYQIPIRISKSYPDPQTIRIGSFNIAHARGGIFGASNWEYENKNELFRHLNDISTQIKKAQLDVIVLNEIDFSASWSFGINQASYIAEKAGYPYVVEQRNMDVAFPFYEFKFGNAILSRHQVIDSEYIDFNPYSKLEDIISGNHDGVFSILQTPLGQIGIIAVHLEYRSEDIRVQAAHRIKEISDGAKFPIIAAGDFNSSSEGFSGTKTTPTGSNALSYLLREGGFQTHLSVINESKYYTFPSEQPKKVLDWILEKGSLKFIDLHVVPSKLSDHFMVTSSLIADDT